MNYIAAPLLGLIITLLNLLCPVLVPLALLFAKWDSEPTQGVQHGLSANPAIIRGDLPGWLSWFSTPDERLPGGLYEPAVHNLYYAHGKFITAWYWLGIRNCLMGMSKYFGKPTTDYAPEDSGFWSRGDVWRYTLALGPIRVILGYQVYRLLDGSFWAYPCFTAKLR